MAVSNEIVSQKFNNYNYAPGIATYGIDGKIGQSGENGNNFYFTDLDLNDNEGLRELISQIVNNRLPLRNSTVELKRKYQNGDLFIDYTGIIYELTDINNLSTSNTDTYKSYFSIAGKINTQDVNNYFDWVGQRLVLNSSYSGYDVITGISSQDASSYIDKNAVVNIISGNIDENDNIEMIRMKSIDSIDVEDGDFSLYYKTTENAYYFDSNKPIIINSDLKVQNDNNVENEYDNYSTVLTSDDTVTYFKHICDKLRYNIIYDQENNVYNLVIYSNEPNEEDQKKTLEYLVNRNDAVFGKIYTGDNDQILVKLNDYIKQPINSSKYYEYMPDYDFRITGCSSTDITWRESIIKTCVVCNDMNVNATANTSINYYQINGINAIYQYISINENNCIKTIELNNINGDRNNPEYKMVQINSSEFSIKAYPDNYTIQNMAYPNVIYPVNIDVSVNNFNNETSYMYFTCVYNYSSAYNIIIKNIMFSKNGNLLNINDSSRYAISTKIPSYVQSISKVALLHNTEIFIQNEY